MSGSPATLRAAVWQANASDDPAANGEALEAALARAGEAGADMLLTPEVTNCLSDSREHQRDVLRHEADDPMLGLARAQAAARGMWILLGSIGVTTDDRDGRFANRSILIDANGDVAACYDKIHMFDVDVDATETYRESAGYRPGDRAVLAQTPWGPLGLTICYDLRFPHLYRALAQAGARILTVPAAFSHVTGAAHWEPLIRARAIETGCFVIAPAQTGTHAARAGRSRSTHGHSMVVAPWGEVLLDAGTEPGLHVVDLDLGRVDAARRRVPSLHADRPFAPPGARLHAAQ
jgi:predicted amidohydrolase